MPTNTAAWITSAKAHPFEVKESPYTSPGPHEIVVKNAAVAANPVDWAVQTHAAFPLTYPYILGEDFAGTVHEIGSAVTRFSVGDRVIGHGIGLSTGKAANAAFQHYTVVPDNMAAEIPDGMEFERAVVIPLGISTAASSLYQKGYLELEPPKLKPERQNKTLLVWGGSTSVGCNGIQVAVASGYDVVATASPRNFELVKKLGASAVFDYKSDTVVADIVEALKGKTVAGALDCITSNGAAEACGQILAQCEGNKLISTVLKAEDELPGGVKTKWVLGTTLKDNEVGAMIYEHFLPKALAEGKYIPAPEPKVVGHGLEKVQEAVDTLKAGVSAKKLVVTL
jgi:NADPH:quinone reductase-like Zn-dependent oxidoreductase